MGKATRRAFLVGSAATLAASGICRAAERRPRVAALCTIYHKYSHSQHIVDRFLDGYGWEGAHHRPAMDVVSLYVDQVGDNDLSRERVSRHQETRIFPTIADALTCGGSDLAVDGVLLIAEHGNYPFNEKGQQLYPRYEFFKQVVDVYRRTGKTAPLFNDKHLSWNWDHAKEMVETAEQMKFGFMAGSSLPVAWRHPSIDLPLGAELDEVVAMWGGGIDGGDIHVIEAMQSIVERRKGGETGVKSIQAIRGDDFFRAIEAGSWESGGCDAELLQACYCRSHQLNPGRATYSHVLPTAHDLRRLAPKSYAYRIEYRDGLRATVVQLQGAPKQQGSGIVGDCNLAARVKGGELFSLMFYLPYYSMRNFFSPLVHHIESLFLTGKPPYPIQRTLLTTGMTASGVESHFQQGRTIETPHLAIPYQPPRESTFWRS